MHAPLQSPRQDPWQPVQEQASITDAEPLTPAVAVASFFEDTLSMAFLSFSVILNIDFLLLLLNLYYVVNLQFKKEKSTLKTVCRESQREKNASHWLFCA